MTACDGGVQESKHAEITIGEHHRSRRQTRQKPQRQRQLADPLWAEHRA